MRTFQRFFCFVFSSIRTLPPLGVWWGWGNKRRRVFLGNQTVFFLVTSLQQGKDCSREQKTNLVWYWMCPFFKYCTESINNNNNNNNIVFSLFLHLRFTAAQNTWPHLPTWVFPLTEATVKKRTTAGTWEDSVLRQFQQRAAQSTDTLDAWPGKHKFKVMLEKYSPCLPCHVLHDFHYLFCSFWASLITD